VHGTSFVLEAELRRDALDADEIISDIGRSLDLLKTVLAEFDYRNLDEFAEFRGRNTTREFLTCEVPSGWCGGLKKVRAGLRPAPVSE
jgi:hypothetical protein